MEDLLHSLPAQILLGNSFIDFQISTRFEPHSFQTDFVFEIISSSLSKGVFSLSSYTFHLNLIREVIIQRIAVWQFWRPLIFFDVTSQYGFFQKILNKITGMGRCTILNKNPIYLWIDLFNGRIVVLLLRTMSRQLIPLL